MTTVPVSGTEFHEKPCQTLPSANLSRPSGQHSSRTPAKTPLRRPVLRIPLWPPFPSLEQNYTESPAWCFRLQFCRDFVAVPSQLFCLVFLPAVSLCDTKINKKQKKFVDVFVSYQNFRFYAAYLSGNKKTLYYDGLRPTEFQSAYAVPFDHHLA